MRSAQHGMAVVVALLVTALAASVAAFAAFRQQVWTRQSENLGDRAQADLIARAGVEFARRVLLEDSKQADKVDDLTEAWASGLPPVPVENGSVTGRIADAQALFNLNNLVDAPHIAQFQRLLARFDLPPDLAYAAADWISKETAPISGPGGAKDTDYLALPVPYRAANQPFTDVDELYRVKGFDADKIAKLRPFITAIQPTAQGTGANAISAINVNTAPAEVIEAVLGCDASAAKAIVELAPFKDATDFTTRTQTKCDLSKLKPQPQFGTDYDVQSSWFLVRTRALFGRSQSGYAALLARQGTVWPILVWMRRELD